MRLSLALSALGLCLCLALSLSSAGVAHADAAPYVLTAAAVSAGKGQATTFHLTVKPAVGYHMNQEYPISLKLVAPSGVKLPKLQLGAKDAKLAEQELAFEVPFTADEAGKKEITGTARFAVCTSTNCSPQSAKVSVSVDVK